MAAPSQTLTKEIEVMKMKFPYLSGSLSPRNRPRKLVMFAVSIAFVLTALLASGGLVKTVSSQDPATDPIIDELRNKAIKPIAP